MQAATIPTLGHTYRNIPATTPFVLALVLYHRVCMYSVPPIFSLVSVHIPFSHCSRKLLVWHSRKAVNVFDIARGRLRYFLASNSEPFLSG